MSGMGSGMVSPDIFSAEFLVMPKELVRMVCADKSLCRYR
jgi:hypothetical protein